MQPTSTMYALLGMLGLSLPQWQCTPGNAGPVVDIEAYMANKPAIGCGIGVWYNVEEELPNAMPVLPGWGRFAWPISTRHDSAQFYFNQGISMYYSFHMIEAKGSFRKATWFDPDCTMAWWGLAMAYGVNYNYAMPKNAPQAMEAMAKALATAPNKPPLEQALAATLPARYNADTTITRQQQNEDYANAIEQVYLQHTHNANLTALLADALMVQHPWDLYDIAGNPKPWTPRIVALLEKGLASHPKHPSLNHLYIHAVEAANNAEKGLPSAQRLSTMMPMVSHMVHMPSHIYIRTGRYQQGMAVNNASLTGYNKYYQLYSPVVNDAFLYQLHNLHMKAACALYLANESEARQQALALQAEVPKEYMEPAGGAANYMQYMYATPLFAKIRYGQWQSIMDDSLINGNWNYARAVQYFAKGMASSRLNNAAQAAEWLQKLEYISKHPSFEEPFESINIASKSISVMVHLLQGTLAQANGQAAIAGQHFEAAVAAEDNFTYNEPRDWLLPTRHYLGQHLLQTNQPGKAIATFNMDLVINPENVWGLTGLQQAYTGIGNTKMSQQTTRRLRKALNNSSVLPTGAIY